MKPIKSYYLKFLSAAILVLLFNNYAQAYYYGSYVWGGLGGIMYSHVHTGVGSHEAEIVFIGVTSQFWSQWGYEYNYGANGMPHGGNGALTYVITYIWATPGGDVYWVIGEHYFLEDDGNSFIETSWALYYF
jgi:hypothetical protein